MLKCQNPSKNGRFDLYVADAVGIFSEGELMAYVLSRERTM